MQEYKDYLIALKRLAATADGKLVLETLEGVYADRTALESCPYLTHYRLGQKELVLALLQDIQEEIVE